MQNDPQNIITSASPETQWPIIHDIVIEGTPSKDIAQKEIEIIPTSPSGEITLNIEEIPPLDVFYNPKHRVVFKRQRKKSIR